MARPTLSSYGSYNNAWWNIYTNLSLKIKWLIGRFCFCCFETIVCCWFFYCWTDVIDIVICFKMFASCVFVLIVHQSRLVHQIRFLNDDMKLFLSFLSSFFSDVKKDDVIGTSRELHQLIDQSNSRGLHFEIHWILFLAKVIVPHDDI